MWNDTGGTTKWKTLGQVGWGETGVKGTGRPSYWVEQDGSGTGKSSCEGGTGWNKNQVSAELNQWESTGSEVELQGRARGMTISVIIWLILFLWSTGRHPRPNSSHNQRASGHAVRGYQVWVDPAKLSVPTKYLTGNTSGNQSSPSQPPCTRAHLVIPGERWCTLMYAS